MEKPSVYEFLEMISKQFKEENRHLIKRDTPFKDLREWTSMQALIVVTAIDEQYDVLIREHEFKTHTTVEALYDLVISKWN